MYSSFKEGLRPNVKKTNKVDGLFVILFGPLILKIVSPLDPHSLMARRNPAYNPKSREILPAHNLFFTQPIVLKLDTENSSITAMLLANLGKIG